MKKNGWLTFIAGAAVGAGITWLFTSKEGKEMVQKMKEKGNDLKDIAEKEFEALKEKLNNHQQEQNGS